MSKYVVVKCEWRYVGLKGGAIEVRTFTSESSAYKFIQQVSVTDKKHAYWIETK